MGIKPPYTLVSRAPTRIDLAGGTVDLWPLYLFLDRPRTINLAIDLFAEARLSCTQAASGSEGQVWLSSGDQSALARLRWADLPAYSPPPALELHTKLLRYFADRHPTRGRGFELRLETRAKSPAGAGLGGSSTLSIALIGALASWSRGEVVDVERDGERFIEVTRDVETTVIKVPAGLQDYYAAMYGGLQSLRWGVGAHSRLHLPDAARAAIEARTLLFYSGQSRNSGINNWALFKGMIDGDTSVRSRFEAISHASSELEGAISQENWPAAASAIAREWDTRRQLATGITTHEIDQAFARAKAMVEHLAPNTSVAGKVCGAGGGGCFFVYVDAAAGPKGAEVRARIETAVVSGGGAGIMALPYRSVPRGLVVEVAQGA